MTIPFPGHACRFYIQGACFYEEALRPGSAPEFRCGPLLRLIERWDDFIDRAEAFGLSEEAAGRIWNARREGEPPLWNQCLSVQTPTPAVRDSRRADESYASEESFACPHLKSGCCLLALPRCNGVCERHSIRR